MRNRNRERAEQRSHRRRSHLLPALCAAAASPVRTMALARGRRVRRRGALAGRKLRANLWSVHGGAAAAINERGRVLQTGSHLRAFDIAHRRRRRRALPTRVAPDSSRSREALVGGEGAIAATVTAVKRVGGSLTRSSCCFPPDRLLSRAEIDFASTNLAALC